MSHGTRTAVAHARIGDDGRVTRTTQTPAPRTVALLGSTGSIGTQAVDIVRRNPDRFPVCPTCKEIYDGLRDPQDGGE